MEMIAAHSVLTMKIAETKEELEQAFRLRYQVFAEEANNDRLKNEEKMETDQYDPYCDHLIVKNEETGQVVGTYRLLPGDRALANKGFYAETEFDLTYFRPYMSNAVEMGRSCIAKEYRNGRVIQMLWQGIADYIKKTGKQYLFGCVSLPLTSQQEISEIYFALQMDGMISDDFVISPLPTHRVPNFTSITPEHFDPRSIRKKFPPLLKGYQWLGAKIVGEPALDPIFQTIDFFVILNTKKITQKYKNHFLG